MTITQTNDGTLFSWGHGRDESVTTNNIKRITDRIERNSGRAEIIIHSSGQPIRFYWDEVTVPGTANPGQLKQIIRQYDLGQSPVVEFTAGAGQTIFPTTFPMRTNVFFEVGGVIQDSTNYTFTIGNTGVVWLGAVFSGGENIKIWTN